MSCSTAVNLNNWAIFVPTMSEQIKRNKKRFATIHSDNVMV